MAKQPTTRTRKPTQAERIRASLADAIVQAIFRGDGQGAAGLMRRHLQLVRSSVGEVSPALSEDAADGGSPAV